MKKHALTAIASIALPLTAMRTPAPAPPRAARNDDAGRKLASLLSIPSPRGSSRVSASGVTPIRSVRIASTAPVRVAIDASEPKPKPKPRRAAAPAAASRSRVRPAAPVKATTTKSSARGGWSTMASWYDDRPAACYDGRGRHAFPRGLRAWTAHKSLPCGTVVAVSGPAGTVRVGVWDRGPYVKGRALDLSAAAFRGACGSTSRGVCRVTYRVA